MYRLIVESLFIEEGKNNNLCTIRSSSFFYLIQVHKVIMSAYNPMRFFLNLVEMYLNWYEFSHIQEIYMFGVTPRIKFNFF